jgi:hypothetical protein
VDHFRPITPSPLARLYSSVTGRWFVNPSEP